MLIITNTYYFFIETRLPVDKGPFSIPSCNLDTNYRRDLQEDKTTSTQKRSDLQKRSPRKPYTSLKRAGKASVLSMVK